jgi:hypothetical protein
MDHCYSGRLLTREDMQDHERRRAIFAKVRIIQAELEISMVEQELLDWQRRQTPELQHKRAFSPMTTQSYLSKVSSRGFSVDYDQVGLVSQFAYGVVDNSYVTKFKSEERAWDNAVNTAARGRAIGGSNRLETGLSSRQDLKTQEKLEKLKEQHRLNEQRYQRQIEELQLKLAARDERGIAGLKKEAVEKAVKSQSKKENDDSSFRPSVKKVRPTSKERLKRPCSHSKTSLRSISPNIELKGQTPKRAKLQGHVRDKAQRGHRLNKSQYGGGGLKSNYEQQHNDLRAELEIWKDSTLAQLKETYEAEIAELKERLRRAERRKAK